jgi:regulator of protease activity HflC (stomatin/prohibitin superfamily)
MAHEELKQAPQGDPVIDKMVDHGPVRAKAVNDTEAGTSLCCPSGLACFMSTVCFCGWCCACTTLNERTESVLLSFGKYTGVLREPGCYCLNPCGISSRMISTARGAIDLISVKVADFKGNPLVVSGVVTYQIVNARKAALEVSNVREYIQTQGLAVMKRIASMFPYEGRDGEQSLKTEQGNLRKQMCTLLQERVEPAGVQVLNFELTDLAYAPEIAQAMLIRQQAEAMVDARKIIVQGAVTIAMGAIQGLQEKGVKLSKEEEARMVSNLLVVICGDAKVQPTVNVSSR